MRTRAARALNPAPRTARERQRLYDEIHYGSGRRSNPDACYDAVSGTILGDPGHPLYGLEVQLVGLDESSGQALVRHASLPNQEAYFPLCPDDDPWLVQPEAQTQPCCVDERTGEVKCPPNASAADMAMHGRTVPLSTITCFERDGTRWCEIHAGDNEYTMLSCPQPPDLIPPPGQPQQCCYDVAAGRLRCDGAWDGLQPSLLALQPQDDGSILAIVMSPDFAPANSTQAFPVCDDPVVDCCYDPTTQTLFCPNSELDGTPAGALATWVGQDGQLYVWAAWRGGAARMPLCPGTDECPPVFCCVNMQSMRWVCPGDPQLHDTPASVANIVTEDGYGHAVLDNGEKVPLCGEHCPPPQLCPDCPTCPPGMWMSPDGTCAEPPQCPPEGDPCPPGYWRDPNGACVPPPQCPTCPPGTLLNTSTGRCETCFVPPGGIPPRFPPFVPPTPCPPKPCCDGCAEGRGCEGCKDDHGRTTNPRKRRIFSGR